MGGLLIVLLGAATGRAEGPYARMLAAHVRPGTVSGLRANLVDYAALSADPDYRRALAELEAAPPVALSRDRDGLAFWLNAYNLLAIRGVVERYPIRSLRDAGSLLFPIWRKKLGVVARTERSLDEIEHGILRKRFADPRIHLALVCASLSCPDLRTEPYAGARLDQQLDDQARRFLGNPTKGLALADDGRGVRVSRIFEWYAGDFAPSGGVASFLREHAPAALRPSLAGLEDSDLTYFGYDWTLNDASRAAAP